MLKEDLLQLPAVKGEVVLFRDQRNIEIRIIPAFGVKAELTGLV